MTRIIKERNRKGVLVYRREDYAKLSNTNAEKGEQKTCWSWLELHQPVMAALTWHTANERMGSARHGEELRQMGVKSGVSDFVTLCAGSHPAGCFELKREQKRGSVLSKEQVAFLLEAEGAGKFAACCHGAEAFKLAVCDYLGIDAPDTVEELRRF